MPLIQKISNVIATKRSDNVILIPDPLFELPMTAMGKTNKKEKKNKNEFLLPNVIG